MEKEKLKRFFVLIVMMGLFSSTFFTFAQQTKAISHINYRVERQWIKIWINEDGSIDLLYNLTLAGDNGATSSINITQPNECFTVGACTDSEGLPVLYETVTSEWCGVSITLSEPILAGQKGSVILRTNVARMTREDEDRPGNVMLWFATSRWDVEVEDLRIAIVLPVGVDSEEIATYPNWDESNYDGNNLLIHWGGSRHPRKLLPDETFTVGVSFSVVEWSKTYGGLGNETVCSVVQTTDGGYALLGYTDSFGAGGTDLWLVKTDANGNEEWNKTFGGKEYDYGMSVVQTVDGGFVLAGITRSFGAGWTDIWLIKTDANGNMQWNRTYGGTDWDYMDGERSVVQTSDGGYAIVGYTNSFKGKDNSTLWLIKTDETGNMQWNRTYGPWWGAFSLVQTIDGGYAMAGFTDLMESDFLLVRTDSTGNILWYRTYGGEGYDTAHSLIQTADGGYAITGETSSFDTGQYDIWLVKTDADGNMQWNRTYGGTRIDDGQSLVQTRDGGYAIACRQNSFGEGSYDFRLVKTDSTGSAQWNWTFGGTGSDTPFSVVETIDGQYALTGGTESFGAGRSDFWLVKLAWPSPTPTFKISNIFAPSAVSVSQDFYISVITSYGFSSEKNVEVSLWDLNSGEQKAITEDALLGYGLKAYDWKLIAPDHVTAMELFINASYLENDSWKKETTRSEYWLTINVVEEEAPVASFRVTQLYFNVEYNGEIYKAFLTENLTAPKFPPTPSYEDADAFYEWKYSKFNWYVLDPNDELVNDESVYQDIAFAAQIASLGTTIWVPHNLRVESELFEEAATWGVRGEICKKVGGMAAAMIPGVLTGGVSTITKSIVAQTLANGIAKGFTDPEVCFTFYLASQLNIAAEKLESAADSIEPTYDEVSENFYAYARIPQGVLVSQSDMLKFYYNVTEGKTYGFSAMRIFAIRFNEGIWGYLRSIIKDAVVANLPVSDTADKIKIWIADAIFKSGEFRRFWEEVEEMERFYDVREKTLKEYARKFCEAFTEGEVFVTLITAETPSGEEVNLLVSTNSVMLSNYVLSVEKSIVITVEGPEESTGTLTISVPKDFLISEGSSIEKVAVTVDGKNSPFTVESLTNTFLIHVQYSHSQRTLQIHFLTHPLSVRVIDTGGQPLPMAKVYLLWEDGTIFDTNNTDPQGYAHFDRVPLGNFTISVEYKSLLGSQTTSISESKEVEISLDVFVEVFGRALTTMQTTLLVVLGIVAAATIAFVAIKRWRRDFLRGETINK